LKKGIHPTLYEDAIIRCACGNVVKVISTKKEMRVEVCSKCHPFFTGELKKKAVERGGRIERFRKKYGIEEE